MRARLLLSVVVISLVAACGQSAEKAKGNASGESIQIDGSSTVFPISEATAEAYGAEVTGGARVSVGESGTGGGFRKFCRGETQVQAASRPISAEEITACGSGGVTYVEVPIAFDGLTVVAHPSNPATSITLAELRRAWEPAAQATITNWNQINTRWPSRPLQLFGPGTASGTFDYFTEAVNGEGGASRTDFTPSEDDNVIVQGVASSEGGMGYFGFAYYEQNQARLKALAINGIAPTAETIASGEYPLARPLFLYFSAEALRRPQVQRFAQYYVANAARLAPQVGYVALPEGVYTTYAERVRTIATGTVFGGHQEVGVDINEVAARPLPAPAQ